MFLRNTRFPGGEIAIATIGRAIGKETLVRGQNVRNVVIPQAHITLDVGNLDRPAGIFGEYASLTLTTTSRLPKSAK